MTHPDPATQTDAKHLIHKVQMLLSLILAGATAIGEEDLDDQAWQNAAEGIEIVAEDARALLYDLIDILGIDDGIRAPK